MADYVSTLTGPQMDAALLDMAEHNSEAYAVGERNGIAVAPDDVTYHNNARYYAQIASSQIVGDASSAVRWDTDQSEALTSSQKAVARNNIGAASDSDVVKITSQTLTTAQQTQARANIAAGGSNPNLLDNSWFTVRQRGDGPFASAGYTVDRWRNMNSSATATFTSDGVTLTADSTGGFRQLIESELNTFLVGKTVTFSILYQDGTIGVWTFEWSASHSNRGTKYNTTIYAGGTNGISINRSATIYIRAVKLELGSVSTLANDAPPDYGEELLKCKRYFQRISGYLSYIATGYCDNTTEAYFLCPLSVPLRSKTVTLSHTGVYINSTNIQAVTGLIILRNGNSVNDASIALKATASGLTTKAPALLQIRAENGYIDLSADL